MATTASHRRTSVYLLFASGPCLLEAGTTPDVFTVSIKSEATEDAASNQERAEEFNAAVLRFLRARE